MNYRHNEKITISPVRLIDQNDEQLGVVPTNEAMRLARDAGMDLVEVAPAARPPVCKIMDYGKWRYQQQKKDDRSRANAKGGQLKELKFRTVKIGDNDLLVKVNHARAFLKEGNKVQFTLQFRGREMAHIDLGRQIFTRVKAELQDVSRVRARFQDGRPSNDDGASAGSQDGGSQGSCGGCRQHQRIGRRTVEYSHATASRCCPGSIITCAFGRS